MPPSGVNSVTNSQTYVVNGHIHILPNLFLELCFLYRALRYNYVTLTNTMNFLN